MTRTAKKGGSGRIRGERERERERERKAHGTISINLYPTRGGRTEFHVLDFYAPCPFCSLEKHQKSKKILV